MSAIVKVDIWSDIACPFCYLGKRRFEEGARASGVPVEVEFRSYEIAPDAPEDGSISHAEHLARKLGVTLDEARAMEARTVQAARLGGLEIDYELMKPARTRTAHGLLHYAKARGLQAEMLERLSIAYFSEGRNIGSIDDLVELAAELELDRGDVRRSLDTDEHLDDIEADIATAAAYGVRGVPFFVIDGSYALAGAQDPSVFADALTLASTERRATD